MNVLNRIVIVLLILVVMILIPLALILPEQAEGALRYAADVIAANVAWINSLAPGAQIGVRLVLAAVGLLIFMVGILFLGLEIVRIRKRTVRLKDGSGELLLDGVAGHLSYHIDLLAGVLRVRPQVERRGKGVRASVYVETSPEVSIPAKSAEVLETARSVIEDKLGLPVVGDIKVLIKPAPYPKGRGVAQPTAAAQPAPVKQPAPVVREPIPVPPNPAFDDIEPAPTFSLAAPEIAIVEDEPLHESDFVVPAADEDEDGDEAIEVKGPTS